jgi:hypothetical protein
VAFRCLLFRPRGLDSLAFLWLSFVTPGYGHS